MAGDVDTSMDLTGDPVSEKVTTNTVTQTNGTGVTQEAATASVAIASSSEANSQSAAENSIPEMMTSVEPGAPASGSSAVPLGVGMTEPEKPSNMTPIVYDLAKEPTMDERIKRVMDEENALRKQRSEKFGTPMVRVRYVDILGSQRAAVRDGFRTGFDVTSKEEAERRRRRALRFGLTEKKVEQRGQIVKARTLEQRREAEYDEPKRENALHMHGVDELDTKDIVKFFLPYGSSWVEWIDDSSCNVVFEDEYTVGRILKFMRRHEYDGVHIGGAAEHGETSSMTKHAASALTGTEASANLKADNAAHLDDLVWREATPVRKEDRLYRMWMRMATVKDRRPDLPNPNSKWSRTMRELRNNMDIDAGATRLTRKRSSKRSRNSMSGVTGSRIKKGTSSVDLDRPLSSR